MEIKNVSKDEIQRITPELISTIPSNSISEKVKSQLEFALCYNEQIL